MVRLDFRAVFRQVESPPLIVMAGLDPAISETRGLPPDLIRGPQVTIERAIELDRLSL